MIAELLNYKVSILNPLLKMLTPLLFLIATYYFYRARNQYQGELGKVVRRLVAASLVGVLANFFRYGADIWFTDLKWGESLMYLLFAVASIYAVWPLLTFINRMAKMSEPAE
jgi:hypothetical protein